MSFVGPAMIALQNCSAVQGWLLGCVSNLICGERSGDNFALSVSLSSSSSYPEGFTRNWCCIRTQVTVACALSDSSLLADSLKTYFSSAMCEDLWVSFIT